MEKSQIKKYYEIGQRIKKARDDEKLTQGDLAKLLKYSSPTFISLIEDGQRKVRVDDLEKIAKFLHRDVNFFITGETSGAHTVQMALRADDGLDRKDVEKVETLIETLKLMKQAQNGRNRDAS